MLGNTLQANGDIWYYDYQGYQISTIQGNTTVNENINSAKLWGVEGELFWAPADRWQFGLNFSHENSSIGDQMLLDTRNPTGGRSDDVLIKDDNISAASGQNCYCTTRSRAEWRAYAGSARHSGLPRSSWRGACARICGRRERKFRLLPVRRAACHHPGARCLWLVVV